MELPSPISFASTPSTAMSRASSLERTSSHLRWPRELRPSGSCQLAASRALQDRGTAHRARPNHSLNRTHCGMRPKACHFILGL